MSPVTTAFDPNPRRVRNIFICSDVVFCASSRMTKASLSVRPRMNAIGATSIVPRSSSRVAFSVSIMSKSASYERPQVRVHLLLQVARQEPELLARLDRRPRQDDAAHLLGDEVAHRLRHRQVGLAGAGGPDAEHDVELLDGVEILALVDALRVDAAPGRPARCPPLQEVVARDRRSAFSTSELRRGLHVAVARACTPRRSAPAAGRRCAATRCSSRGSPSTVSSRRACGCRRSAATRCA